MKLYIIAGVLLLTFNLLGGQEREISITTEAAGEGRVTRRAVFDGNSLWGYINGGADIYLEYGFTSLTMHEIDYRGALLRFDLYEMGDASAAYGIFSVYSFECDTADGPGEFNCATRWQIQSVKGEYYLSAILGTGTADEFSYAKGIASFLMEGIEHEPFEPGFPFREGMFNRINGQVKYCRGQLGLDNGIPFRNDALSVTGFRELWHLTRVKGYESLAFTAITFNTAVDRDKFVGEQSGPEDNEPEILTFSDGNTLLLIYGERDGLSVDNVINWFQNIER